MTCTEVGVTEATVSWLATELTVMPVVTESTKLSKSES